MNSNSISKPENITNFFENNMKSIGIVILLLLLYKYYNKEEVASTDFNIKKSTENMENMVMTTKPGRVPDDVCKTALKTIKEIDTILTRFKKTI